MDHLLFHYQTAYNAIQQLYNIEFFEILAAHRKARRKIEEERIRARFRNWQEEQRRMEKRKVEKEFQRARDDMRGEISTHYSLIYREWLFRALEMHQQFVLITKSKFGVQLNWTTLGRDPKPAPSVSSTMKVQCYKNTKSAEERRKEIADSVDAYKKL